MFGLMRTKTHRRKFVELGQSYRAEIEQHKRDARIAKGELDDMKLELVPRVDINRDFATGNYRITIDIDPRSVMYSDPMTMQRMLMDSIHRRIVALVGDTRDYRGDMRQTDAQRALGIYR